MINTLSRLTTELGVVRNKLTDSENINRASSSEITDLRNEVNDRNRKIDDLKSDLTDRSRDISDVTRQLRGMTLLAEDREKTIDKMTKGGESRPKQINPTQPTFSGKPAENVSQWLYTMEQNLNLAKVADNDKPTYASTYLRDVALQYYQQISRGTILTWDLFKTSLKNQFQPSNYNELLLDRIDKLQQTGTVNEYIQQFMYLINQTENVSEASKIHMFRKGLPTATSAEIRYKKPATLQNACNMAMEFEESYLKKSDKASGFFSEINSTAKTLPYNRPYHIRPRYKTNNRFKYRRYYDKPQFRTQYKYQKTDTNKANSTNPGTDTKKKEASSKQNEIIPRTYYKGKKPEVNSIDYEFVTTKALINDNMVEVLFDTGAKQSVIAYDTVKKYNLPYSKSNETCYLGNGALDTIYGITEPLRVIIHGSICEMEFMILPRHNTLIGLDWFNTVQAHVETYNQTLVFKTRIIPLVPRIEGDEEINYSEINLIDNEEISEEIDEPWNANPEKVNIGIRTNLSEEENKQFMDLLDSFKDTIAETFNDLDKPCQVAKFTIETTTEHPIRIPPYRKSYKEREAIKKEVEMMMKAGIIQLSQSPWSFPVVLIPKRDGTSRFCVDYRKLNAITLQDPFPIPRIDDIIDRLNGSKWFSALDLKAGYWQIQMDDAHICKTAFSTPDGHYEFKRLPFGLKNAPAAFSRIMFQVLGDLSYVEIYLDDITIHSPTVEKHLQDIKEVLQRLKNVSLKINLKKCNWFQKSIQILGHIIEENSIKNGSKEKRIDKNWKQPRTVLHTYNKQQILDIEVVWKWDEDCVESLKLLQQKLILRPILQKVN